MRVYIAMLSERCGAMGAIAINCIFIQKKIYIQIYQVIKILYKML